MTLFIGINIENLYTKTKLPSTITKYNQDTGEPYTIDAGLYKFNVGDLTFEEKGILEYDWQAHGLTILHAYKPEYNNQIHKSMFDYYVGIEIGLDKKYLIGDYKNPKKLTLFENIESVIELVKERLTVITSYPNIVVLHKEDTLEIKHEGVPC